MNNKNNYKNIFGKIVTVLTIFCGKCIIKEVVNGVKKGKIIPPKKN